MALATPSDGALAQVRWMWAKSAPRHPLWKHMLDSAAASLALPDALTRERWTAEQVALVVALHDIGKADAAFQHQVREFSEGLRDAGYPPTGDVRCRHERLSARFIRNRLKAAAMDDLAAMAMARAVIAHHGHWDESARGVAKEYEEAQERLCQMLEQTLGAELPRLVPADLSSFGMRLAGHIVLADWIASNEKFFQDGRLRDIDEPGDYLRQARIVASEWTEKLGFDRNRSPGKAACIVETPRPIQKALLEHDIPPALVIIEAPMGDGKTEAAWILAEKWRENGYHGMYMALPTMATSDSLHSRYRLDYLAKLGSREDLKLVHGMAWLRDDNEPERAPEVGEPGDDRSLAAAWFRPTRRAMLAAHGVGTVDQAMLAGMNVKFGFLRLFGLSDRVLVIDEVHAYDAYMSAIIGRLLQWCACLKIPVILLSATLSARQRAAMIEAYGATGGDPGPEAPYPLITVAEPGKETRTINTLASSSRTLRIESHQGLLGDATKTAELAAALVKQGGCCCVILNTVKQAQSVYRALNLPEEQKLLFHARFTAADRERIAHTVLAKFGKDTTSRRATFVLVATQVVEQSLDVDFDHMISEIAPIDLLLQRSGRLHRHSDRAAQPVLHVLLPEAGVRRFGGTGYVYAEKPLLRTLAILAEARELRLPCDFRLVIERCYGTGTWQQDKVDWATIREADQAWDRDVELLRHQGSQFALCEPSKRAFRPVNNDPTGDDSDDGNGWRARTRLGANDRMAVLVGEHELPNLEVGQLRMSEVQALYRRSLRLPSYLPVHCPGEEYSPAAEGQGKLRGLLLLPLGNNGLWCGHDGNGNRYEVDYDKSLGLVTRRVR